MRPRSAATDVAVAVSELLLALKADGKAVLERYLEPSKKVAPAARAPYLAIGNLGLANHDNELAAENFREGLKRFPDDPDFALFRNSFYEPRSPQVIARLKRYIYLDDRVGGTGHGTVHDYELKSLTFSNIGQGMRNMILGDFETEQRQPRQRN